jgi:hypothetical protein
VQDVQNRLWSVDGDRPPARIDVPDVMTAGFADRDHGAAIASGGALFVTNDGGASWEPRILGRDAAAVIDRDNVGLWAILTNGTRLSLASTPDDAMEADSSFARTVFEAAINASTGWSGTHDPRLRHRPGDVYAVTRDAIEQIPTRHLFVHDEPARCEVPTHDSTADLALNGGLGAAANAFAMPDPYGRPEPRRFEGFTLVGSAFRTNDWGHGPPNTRPDEHVIGHTPIEGVPWGDPAGFAPGPLGIALRADSRDAVIAWRGVDARGRAFAHLAHTQLDAPPELDTDGDGSIATPRWTLVTTTPNGAVFTSAIPPASEDRVRVFWLTEGPPRDIDTGIAHVADVAGTPLDDGGAILAVSGAARTARTTLGSLFSAGVSAVVVLAPDGTVRERRSFTWGHSALPTAAILESTEGVSLVQAGVTGAAIRWPLDGSQPATFDLPRGRVEPCGTERAVSRLHVFPRSFTDSFDVTIGSGFDSPDYADVTHAVVEIHGSRACVRAMDAAQAWSERGEAHSGRVTSFPRRALHLYPNGRGFAGSADNGVEQAAVDARIDSTGYHGSPE